MMVPPGFSAPLRSASSTIDSAIRSLIEPPGLLRSDLIHTGVAVAEQAVDADVRGAADGLENVRSFHGRSPGSEKKRILAQSPPSRASPVRAQGIMRG